MPKIILINTPHPARYPIFLGNRDISTYYHFSNRRNRIPIDLGYVAAAIKRKEKQCDLRLIEANAGKMTVQEAADAAARSQPEIVIANTSAFDRWVCPYPSLSQPRNLFKELRKRLPDSLLIAIGPHMEVFPKTSLQEMPHVDVGVMGEPEETVAALVARVLAGHGPEGLAGTIVRKGSEIEVNSKSRIIENLDKLPFPLYEIFSFDIYQKYGFIKSEIYKLEGRSSFILSSRGCPFRCTYCALYVHGRGFRARSPRNVVDEIELLAAKYGVRILRFQDPEFAIDPKRAKQICDLMVDRQISIKWSAEIRYGSSSKDLLEAMKSAGCYQLNYGLESASQTVLDAIDKKQNVKEAEEIIRLTSSIGIHASNNILVGLSGESEESVDETIGFVKRLSHLPKVSFARASLPVYYPDTKLYQNGIEEGRYQAIETWSDFNRVLAASGTVQTDFRDLGEVLSQVDRFNSAIRRSMWKTRYGTFYPTNPRFFLSGVKTMKKRLGSYGKKVSGPHTSPIVLQEAMP